ncbi:MAG: NADH-quinone oxidoreductase subunit N [Opitutaceae bacterium]|jgi:NADH-quinone oxidoreductase subunit N|nr:NADH-quinone oxidoreductase subunit N [Opitutaceae bacterium]
MMNAHPLLAFICDTAATAAGTGVTTILGFTSVCGGDGYAELFRRLAPEAVLVIGALLVLGFDLFAGKRAACGGRATLAALIGVAALAGAGFAAAWISPFATPSATNLGSALETCTAIAVGTRLGVYVLSGLTLLLLPGSSRLRHPAEYTAIILFATVGFSLMAAASNLLLGFLAIELASLSLYILTGFDKTRPDSAEAGLKYFLFGGTAAAFMLFGFSLLYGLTGSINMFDFAYEAATRSPPSSTPLMLVALVMVLAGFGFKVAAVPFHLWAPDAYQGAPASAAALIASASKLAGIAFFLRLLWGGLGRFAGDVSSAPPAAGWMPVVAVLALGSLLVGNLGALAQTNVRRLLAYSAIAHAGVMLLGVIAAGGAGAGPLFYYVATYGLATVGAFGVISVIERDAPCQKLADLAGLWKRSPLLALTLFAFVLSLAGVPPLAGFFGKFAVFAAVLKLNGLAGPAGWLALLAIAFSAVALYYYLAILKQALVAAPAGDAKPVSVPALPALSLVLCAALLLLLGLFPSLLLSQL